MGVVPYSLSNLCSKDFCTFISFPFLAMKKEKKQKQRKGKHATKRYESSETTFPNLPLTAQRAVLEIFCFIEPKSKLTWTKSTTTIYNISGD